MGTGNKEEEKFELIIPARIYIINKLEEAREFLDKYPYSGITINRLKGSDNEVNPN